MHMLLQVLESVSIMIVHPPPPISSPPTHTPPPPPRLQLPTILTALLTTLTALFLWGHLVQIPIRFCKTATALATYLQAFQMEMKTHHWQISLCGSIFTSKSVILQWTIYCNRHDWVATLNSVLL